MKLLKATIKVNSNFATPLQGDTIFGQICLAIKYILGEKLLENLLIKYENEPFLIVSDGFPKNHLPKPTMPMNLLKENKKYKKENSKKIWLEIEDLKNANYLKAKETKYAYGLSQENKNPHSKINVMKNSLNYLTSRTEKEKFSPFGQEEYNIKRLENDIYFLLSPSYEKLFDKQKLEKSLEFIGSSGYGKDISTGKGKFKLLELKDINNINYKSTAFMTLSLCSVEELKSKDLFYSPLTKFAKHSADLVDKNIFKKPMLFANTSAVITYDKEQNLKYVGKAIKNFSSFHKAVQQGYSIVFPLKDIYAK